MLASSIPAKFPEPFAQNATSSFIRPIPETSADPDAASLDLGFPPNTFIAEEAGGVPPDGRDFNGLFFQITSWCQWLSSGGPVTYDGTYSTAIGGYPKGAWLQATAGNAWWVSQVDNNTSNPDTGGANWLAVSFGKAGSGSPVGAVAGNAPVNGSVAQSLYYDLTGGTGLWICTTTGNAATAVWVQVGSSGTGPYFCGTTGGTPNAQTATTPTSLTALTAGALIECKFGFTNTGAMTLALSPSVGPSFGSFPVRKQSVSGAAPLASGDAVATNAALFLYDGAIMHLLNPAQGTAAQANASSLTGSVAAVSGTFTPGHIVVAADSAGTVADGGPPPTSGGSTVISSSGTVSPGIYYCDTSGGAFTVTLSLTLSGAYTFLDPKNTWSSNPVTINGNGANISNTPTGGASTFIANVSNGRFSILAAGTYWRLEA